MEDREDLKQKNEVKTEYRDGGGHIPDAAALSGVRENTEKEEKPEKNAGRFYWVGILTGIVFSLLVVCGVFIVRSVINAGRTDSISVDSTETADENSVVNQNSTAKLQVLQNTIDQYYLNEVDEASLEDGMYAGLLKALEDPYSVYYTAEELKQLQEQTAGIYYGIGAYIGIDATTNYPYISKIIDNTPASESDLQVGDLIYEIEGESVYGFETTETVMLIKGEEGTAVNITVARPNGNIYDYIDISITRAKINSPTVVYKMLDHDIAYIEITEFDDVTTDQFTDAYATAKGSGMKGLILDLRGNPGGNLTTVVNIARQLLPEGMIVYTEDKYGIRDEYTCDGKNEIQVPLVVLVDGNSASASEILAGAIKDYGIGTLVGTTTFGKGIVQRILQLTDGSAVKLTISKYYTPNGNNIHGIGIDPDMEITWDVEAYIADGTDNQLNKAVELMNQKLGIE